MAIKTNAQRITRIYRGSTKVYQDTRGEWIDIPIQSPLSGTAKYAVIENNIVLWIPAISFWVDSYENSKTQTILEIPSEYKEISPIGSTAWENSGGTNMMEVDGSKIIADSYGLTGATTNTLSETTFLFSFTK